MAAANLPHAVLNDDDGFTVDRFVNEVPRLYPALKFTYRPVDATRRGRYIDKRSESNEETLIQRLSEVVASQLVSWDAKDQKGNLVEQNADGVKGLHPVLLNRLFNIIVWSSDPGDDLPSKEKSADDSWDSHDDEKLRAAQGNS